MTIEALLKKTNLFLLDMDGTLYIDDIPIGAVRETLARLLDILRRYGLPTETGYELDKLYEAELVDKKISGGKMHLIVPEKIGQVRMETIPVEALRDWMQDGGIR